MNVGEGGMGGVYPDVNKQCCDITPPAGTCNVQTSEKFGPAAVRYYTVAILSVISLCYLNKEYHSVLHCYLFSLPLCSNSPVSVLLPNCRIADHTIPQGTYVRKPVKFALYTAIILVVQWFASPYRLFCDAGAKRTT